MVEILELAKYVVPSLVVFATAYLVLRSFLNNNYKKKYLELKLSNQKDSLPIRLQAYERLTLLLERISPNSLIHRVNSQGMGANELRNLLVSNIRKEFDHNVSQQIYVSPLAWNVIVTVKEELVSVINRVEASLPADSQSIELSKGIMHYYKESEKVPMQEALDKLKAEARRLY